jgi:hypothetical protein
MDASASSSRAARAKQAQLAAAELAALAASAGEDGTCGGAAATRPGILGSFLQHMLTTLLRRLQLTIRNLHMHFVDPVTGRSFGLRMQRLHTCLPGEVEHPSALLADDAGVAEHASAAARGSIQKQFAMLGGSFYWIPARPSEDESSFEAAATTCSPPAEPLSEAGHEEQKGGTGTDAAKKEEVAHELLRSTDCVLHITSSPGSSAGSPRQVHASSIIYSLSLSIRKTQLADVVLFMDQLAWLTARSRHAALRPPGLQLGGSNDGSGETRWGELWRYAVNAVLLDSRGSCTFAPWRPWKKVQQLRRQYVYSYRSKLEAGEGLAAGGGSGDNSNGNSDAVPLSHTREARLQLLELELSIDDIMLCRKTAQALVRAAGVVAAGPGGSEGGDKGAPRRSSAGYLALTLAKAAGAIGYVPRVLTARGGAAPLPPPPPPSDAEVEELYEALDFRIADDAEEIGTAAGAGVGTVGLRVTLDCLVSTAELALSDDGTWDRRRPPAAVASIMMHRLRLGVVQQATETCATVTANDIVFTDLHGADRRIEPRETGVRMLSRSLSSQDAHHDPLFRLQLVSKTGASRPTVDILIHPLVGEYRPECVLRLAGFVPPPAHGSFAGAVMASVNALPPAARAVVKADLASRMGPSIDLLIKASALADTI